MPMYLRHTRSVHMDELPARIRDTLIDHAESRQIDLGNVRMWMTRSENPPANSGLGKLLRRRANPTDPDDMHVTVVVLHPTQIVVVVDGEKRGTAALSLPLALASVARGTALTAALTGVPGDSPGFTITGFEGERTGSFYVGLGPEAAGAECFSAVQSAIAAAKNPSS